MCKRAPRAPSVGQALQLGLAGIGFDHHHATRSVAEVGHRVEHAAVVAAVAVGLHHHHTLQAQPGLHLAVHRDAGHRRGRSGALTEARLEDMHVAVAGQRRHRPVWRVQASAFPLREAPRLLGIHRTDGHAALQQLAQLGHRLQRLVFDGRWRQTADVRRGNHPRMPRQHRRGHLVGRTSHIHGAAGQVADVQRLQQGALVDQVAARGIDEERTGLHRGEAGGVHQVLGCGYRWRQAHHMVGPCQQRAEFELLDAGASTRSCGSQASTCMPKAWPSAQTRRPICP